MLATAASADEGPEGTRGEILKALHMEQQGVDAMNALFKILADNASLVDTQTDIQLACALFVRQGYPIYGGYPSFLADYYHADYEQLDFASPKGPGAYQRLVQPEDEGPHPQHPR